MDLFLNENKQKGIFRFNTQINLLGDFEFMKKDYIN